MGGVRGESTRRSLLDAEHRALGARMTPFGGWEMPLQYEGVLDEHRRCRDDAVVFDVSHLGAVRVAGDGAYAGLQSLFTNDLARIGPGRAQYTHLLDPDDAHVVDDVIVWWLPGGAGGAGGPEEGPGGPDGGEFLVIPNASNTEPALAAMREAVPGGSVGDVTGERAFLAVQGPQAKKRLGEILPEAAEVGHFEVRPLDGGVIAGGTGYTGEDSVELFVPEAAAVELWRRLVDAGVSPAGLGARDTLRLEMGYPLHGHELGPGITPLQAGLGWVVAWDKGEFRGRAALEAERAAGVSRRLRGLVTPDRRIPRQGCAVMSEGAAVGEVTSGNFSPTLERGIGLALLQPSVELGSSVTVLVRDREVPADVVAPPFVER